MKSKRLKGVINLNKALSNNYWTNYRKFLGRIVEGLSDTFEWRHDVMGALRNQDVDRLLALADSLSSQKYDDATHHFVANQVAYLIKKFPFPPSLGSFNPEKKAREKFLASEATCRLTNEYFTSQFFSDGDVQWKFHNMRNFIAYVLGNVSLASIYGSCDFGPGANIGVNGNASNIKQKIACDWTVTPSALMYGYAAFVQDFSLMRCFSSYESPYVCLDPDKLLSDFREACTVINYNKIAFVPKTTATHRVIAVEPLINGYVQKGVDAVMRRKLLRIGIDLSDQSINSSMAYQGSLEDSEDSFVTIDLSSASDSISIGLCRELLPPDWFELLYSLRPENYLLDGVVTRYEKFCSMGNGFCFPLETLLFTAAAHAVGAGTPGRDFHVYGDDIIVRKSVAQDLLNLLGVMGFSVNTEKTFLSGPFRESCGTDWFGGKDVRPFILDFRFDSLESIFKFLNLSRRSALTECFFLGVRDFVKSLIPTHLLFLRPEKGPPDTGVDAEIDEFMASPHARWSKDLQRWRWLELHHVPIQDRSERRRSAHALMIAALRGASANQPFVYRRKTVTTVRVVPHSIGGSYGPPRRVAQSVDAT